MWSASTQVGDAGDLVVGPDGRSRCAWGASPEDYARYHDEEWGNPVHGDDRLFERLTLEAFQSGLSWLTILRKREGFRRAFREFSIRAVATFDDGDEERLMADAGIVRNRAKIKAAIHNARAAHDWLDVEGEGALDRLIWSHAPTGPRPRPSAFSELAASTDDSKALAKALKAHGFVFVGPTTMYAAMQACGVVNDHLVGCHRAGATPDAG